MRPQTQLCSEETFNWKNSKIKALGIWLSTETSQKKFQKLHNCLGCLSLHRLCLIGKITVLECLATSQIINLLTPLQSNSLIRLTDKTIFYRNCYEKGLFEVKHLVKETPNIFMLPVEHKYCTKTCSLTYNGIISAIKDLWKKTNSPSLQTITKNKPLF